MEVVNFEEENVWSEEYDCDIVSGKERIGCYCSKAGKRSIQVEEYSFLPQCVCF